MSHVLCSFVAWWPLHHLYRHKILPRPISYITHFYGRCHRYFAKVCWCSQALSFIVHVRLGHLRKLFSKLGLYLVMSKRNCLGSDSRSWNLQWLLNGMELDFLLASQALLPRQPRCWQRPPQSCLFCFVFIHSVTPPANWRIWLIHTLDINMQGLTKVAMCFGSLLIIFGLSIKGFCFVVIKRGMKNLLIIASCFLNDAT